MRGGLHLLLATCLAVLVCWAVLPRRSLQARVVGDADAPPSNDANFSGSDAEGDAQPRDQDLEDRSKARTLLSSADPSPRFLALAGRGVVCTNCCISVDPSFVQGEDTVRQAGGVTLKRYLTRWYPNDTVSAWPAHGRELLPGLSHVVWTLEHKNVLFNLAEAANAWRTWIDIGEPVDRVFLWRDPRDNYKWLYSQLRGGPTAPADPPQVLKSPSCFEKVVVGSITKLWTPWSWPWGLRCKRPALSKLDSTWHMGLAAYLQSRLPPVPRQAWTIPPCRAALQLRGAAEGPDREARGRNFLNSKEVAELLEELGFQVDSLDLRAKSMPEAGAIMHASHLVVAPHGAGIANLIFCRPGGHTTVIELHNWGAQKWGYESFAMVFGVRYIPLICSSTRQCPLSPLATEPRVIEEEAAGLIARQDICRQGVHNSEFYDSNHTLRDIQADIPGLRSIAAKVLTRLQDEGICQASSQASPARPGQQPSPEDAYKGRRSTSRPFRWHPKQSTKLSH